MRSLTASLSLPNEGNASLAPVSKSELTKKPFILLPFILVAISERPDMKQQSAVVQNGLAKLLARSWCAMRELQRSNIPVLRKSVPVLYFGNLQRYLSSPLRVI